VSFDWDILWWIIITLLFIGSYLGLVVPGVPDAPLMFAGFLVYHFLIDNDQLAWWFWLAMVPLMLLMVALDWLSSGFAAKKLGGSKGTLIVAPLGALLGFWFPFGIIWGPFVAVLILELFHRKPLKEAGKIAFGTVVGFFSNVIVKVILLTLAKAWFFFLVA
jgi:uncharacterized protein